MPLPSTYSEAALAAYIVTVTGTAASALGWASADFAEAVNDALIACGVTSISDATDIPKLRAAARLAGWRAIVQGVAGMHSFSADGQSMALEQVQQMAFKALGVAESDAAVYGVGGSNVVRVVRLNRVNDPYSVAVTDAELLLGGTS